ncbi:MAG: DUF2497 domain-containing protein, partial [Acidisphaera sp.]|nr:DUF2497 domain-containing protein [Acidisphaera sp.]
PASRADAAAELPPAPAHAPLPDAEPEDDVLLLDDSMLVAGPSLAPSAPPIASRQSEAMHADPVRSTPERAMSSAESRAPGPGLLGSASADTAASAIKNLVRTMAAERSAPVHRGGPTIEDVVREELRPLLKAWLDTNLPPLVERLVRAEIERVVGRAVG